MECSFRGSYVALPTPFDKGVVDFAALERLVDWHATKASDGLVAVGTTGEGATLSDYERRSVIERVVERSAGRLPVIAGVGTHNTAQSIELVKFARAAGANGALVVTPYYNKPTPRGLVAHFEAVAEASELPVVLYNVPSRTGCDMKAATVAEIRKRCPNAVAIKEASGSLGRAREIRELCDIALIAGEDALISEFMGLGALGVIGVVANIAPAQTAELCRAARPGGDPMRAAELVAFLSPLVRDLFLETNPAPVKCALAAMGKMREDLRLPLVTLEPGNRERLLSTLREAGLV
ncbi:MAG: 4-hydroxy-tetrahydrodipicolinate synthase [Planctomycetes bacterium]|nr:4-hydroxy-tetrahydrodipicolinate synthase [Planctomycetota bacterium]